MHKWIKGGIAFVLTVVASSIIDRLIDYSGQILPSMMDFILSDIILIVGLIVGGLLIALGIWKSEFKVKRIDGVQAFIFWPKGIPVENKTLDYHRKHFHKKLIVNFKTTPPEAYYLVASKTSYSWKLIGTFSDLYTSIEDSTYPNPDTPKWCEENGYHLNPHSASEEDLKKSTENKGTEIYFKAEILNKKKEYGKTDSVFFRTSFRGCVKYGFIDNKITNLEGKSFQKRWYQLRKRPYTFSHHPDTLKYRYKFLPNFLIRGRLNGYINQTFDWAWVIPKIIPSGQYTVSMRIYDEWLVATAFRETEDTITII